MDDGDQFWLVCDCDHWVEPNHIGNLTLVLQECRQKGVHVAISNPCFDLWLLLHFAEHPENEGLTCSDIAARIRVAVSGGYDKTKVYNLPIKDENVGHAIRRARGRDSSGSAPVIPKSPGTTVHRIVEDLAERKIITIPKQPDRRKKR
jgi:hypothetical protein